MPDDPIIPTPAPRPRPQNTLVKNERDLIIARLASKSARLVAANKLSTAETAQLKAEIAQLRTELARLSTLADGNIDRQRADGLAAELRDIKHRGVFARLARQAGADADSIDDLWTLSGYVPAADLPDEAAIGAVVAALKANPARAKFFAPPAGPPPAPEPKPGPSPGRGGPSPAPSMDDGIDESALEAMQRHPVKSYENRDKIAHWLKNGLVRRGV